MNCVWIHATCASNTDQETRSQCNWYKELGMVPALYRQQETHSLYNIRYASYTILQSYIQSGRSCVLCDHQRRRMYCQRSLSIKLGWDEGEANPYFEYCYSVLQMPSNIQSTTEWWHQLKCYSFSNGVFSSSWYIGHHTCAFTCYYDGYIRAFNDKALWISS